MHKQQQSSEGKVEKKKDRACASVKMLHYDCKEVTSYPCSVTSEITRTSSQPGQLMKSDKTTLSS